MPPPPPPPLIVPVDTSAVETPAARSAGPADGQPELSPPPPPPHPHPHPHSRDGLAARFGPNYRWWVLLTVMLGGVASLMASTIINVAVPEMSRVFGLGQERAQWLSAGFMAAMTISMLTTPWLLHRHGYRRTYGGAVLLLLVGGAVGGSSPWFDLVLAMRVAEGLAAGVLQPIPAIIVFRAFAPSERGKAMGIYGFGVVLAPALGPSAGGVLIEWFGWRSIFFVVLPFCIAALALARRFLPVGGPGGAPPDRDSPPLDLTGLALVSVALLTLLNGMVQLHAQGGAVAWSLLAASLVSWAGFVLHQRRSARPLMELRLFGHHNFVYGAIVAFIYGMGLFGSTYLVPVFLQIALKLPPSQAGVALLPAGIALALTIPVAGRLTDRLPYAGLVGLGLALLSASFLAMISVGPATALVAIMAWALVGRVGLGFVLPSLNVGAMLGLPESFIAHGASTINFMRQIGGAVGVSLVGIVLEWRLSVRAGEPVRAFHDTFGMIGVIMGLAVLAAVRMRGRAAPAAAGTPG